MKTKTLSLLSLSLTLLIGGTSPSPLQREAIQQDLDALVKRGFTYRMLDNEMIELTDPLSGEKHLKCLREPSEVQIRSWAAQRGIPILEIDPSQVDTTLYSGWYTHFAVVPLSNGFGIPLVLADLDGNKESECYGAYEDSSMNVESRCYEIDTNGSVTLRYSYFPLQGASRCVLDADGDSLIEIMFTFGGPVLDYEQAARDSLPTDLRFVHNRYGSGDPGSTGIFVGDLDGDSLTDFLYKGSDQDSTKVFVAEYNQQANNFVRVWSTNYGLGGVAGIGGFAVDDFDGDGKKEFVATELVYRKVLVVENTGDNSYAITWQDSTPFTNLDHAVGGDVDGDGKPEFFAGGSTFGGSWTVVYEADSNDHYTPRFMFHLAGGFFDLTYLVTDVDGDGHPEFVVLASGYLHVFKSIGDDHYRLWYFRHDDNTDAVQFYDVDGDGRKEILISKGVNGVGFFADIYATLKLVSVGDRGSLPSGIQLLANYPNPFNPSTSIEYSVAARGLVLLRVFNILGEEVANLVDSEEDPGRHSVIWNAANASSGLYFCCLETAGQSRTIKLVVVR